MLPRKGLKFSKLPIGCNLTNGRIVLLLLLIGCAWANEKEENKNFAVTHNDDTSLLVSTLSGALYALDSKTGDILWKLMDEPVVKSPYNPEKPVMPAFLPDPKDGSLYMMGGSMTDPLKKLPFTIPQLVAGSPSKSAEGILYSGKKVDTWFSVDRRTGHKHGSLNYQGCIMGEINTCPVTSPGSILIGRTEYNLMMFDTRTQNRKWNITFYDYTTNMANRDILQDYGHAHFTDSSTGILLTMDRTTGQVDWEIDLESPVVGMYLVQHDSMYTVPFRSVSIETLENLLEIESDGGNLGNTKLFPTLYIGEHSHGLFAVPCLVDQQTIRISPQKNQPLLLDGKVVDNNVDTSSSPLPQLDKDTDKIPEEDYSALIVLGHYSLPEFREETPLQITDGNIMSGGEYGDNGKTNGGIKLITSVNQTENDLKREELEFSHRIDQLISFNTTFILSADFIEFLVHGVLPRTRRNIMQMENKELKLITVVVCLTLAWFVRFVKTKFDAWEKNSSNSLFKSYSNSLSNGSGAGSSQYEVTATPVELASGEVKVGNITFDPTKVLGRGCEGTFVYQGKFDNRNVAVKRVLAACFSIADREVDLLRESDEHPNVIRYFCMEQCRQFRYIALELCVATLQDFVEGKYKNPYLEPTVVFKQSVQGLAHLHSLDIAHRDIKPQNVLLSVTTSGSVRAMISDFGLCKKLKLGRMSFSQRSGVAGTEGWIAPEMLLEHQSTTCMVDVFSLGCVYYYILTKGKHPFGDAFHRQANILSGRCDLSLLETDNKNTNVISLLEKMLSFEPRERPPVSAILKHPVFWNKEKLLGFLQDVSDRVDKEEEGSVVLLRLERGAESVFVGEWNMYLDDIVREDLRKQRTYRNTMKDLLRALRNKKHHYRELSDPVREAYGSMPDGYIHHWMSRFPNLLTYTYTTMHCVKYEPEFHKYYDKDYDFVKTRRSIDSLDSGSLPTKNNQRDLFDSTRTQDSRLSNNSLISNWENIDSSKLLKNQESRDDHEMLPCYRENQTEKGDQSFLRMMAQKEDKTMVPVRKPVEEKVELSASPPEPLNFAKAVKNPPPSPGKPRVVGAGTAPVAFPSSPYRAPAFRQQNSPSKGQWRNTAVVQNNTSEPVLSVHNSEPVLTVLAGREPVSNIYKSSTEPVIGSRTDPDQNNVDIVHSIINTSTEPVLNVHKISTELVHNVHKSSTELVHNVHKSSTEPVLRHIPSEGTLTNKIQSEPALKTFNTDNDSESPCENTIDYFDDDFRTINDTCKGENDPKSVNIETCNDNTENCDNENKEILADIVTEKGDASKEEMADDNTTENTIPTENCDNNKDDDNNEDEGSGEDKKGKRVRKRRKHQKKAHVPRFIGVEEVFVE